MNKLLDGPSSFDFTILTSFLFCTFLGDVNKMAIAPTINEARIVPMVFVRDISVFMTTL